MAHELEISNRCCSTAMHQFQQRKHQKWFFLSVYLLLLALFGDLEADLTNEALFGDLEDDLSV